MARPSRGGGSGGRRSRTYWMRSCGGWNWDWRTTCLVCAYAAPPWALDAAAKAKPQADKDGWVDQPRGRRAQRQARSATTSAATSKSQTSASGASGTPSGSGATAIERLQVAVEQLEALQAQPPDGVDCCFTDVVASQLEAKRAELAEAQRAAAEQQASSMPLKAEKRLRAARQSLEQKQELDKLPEAWGSCNFEVAWAAIRSQVEAVRAQLAEAPVAPRRAPWAESRPVDEISSEDGDRAGGCRHWQPQCAAEVAQACKRELAAEAPPAPGQAATAAQDVRSGLEEFGVNGNAWRWSLEGAEASGPRSGDPPRLVVHQETRLAPHRLEEARGEARRMGSMAFLHASAPTDKEGPLASSGGVAGWRQGWRGVTVPAVSDLQLLACSLYLRGALRPIGFNLDSFTAFGDSVLYQRPRFIPVVQHQRDRPLGVARNVDGDIALQAVGTEQLVAAWLGGAGLGVACRLRGQHLPLSAAKTTFLAPSPSLGCQLGACGKSQGGTLCETLQARNLGSDPASAKLDPIHKAGPAASGMSGRTVTGNADGELHSWRLAASRSARELPIGAERGLRMRYAELRRRRYLDPVQMKAGLLQEGELPPMVMERGLEAARHATIDGPWRRCASPFDAEMLTRARIGWHFKSERRMIADIGDELDLRHLGPQELGWEAGPGARSASFRHETRMLSHGACLLRARIFSPHWAQARLLDAREQGQARCCGAERGTLRHRQHGGPGHEAKRHDRDRGLPAHWPPQGRRADAMGSRCVRRPSDEKLYGKLYLDGATLEPLFGAWRCEGGATAHRDGDGNLAAEVYGAVGSDRCPQRTAKDGEDLAAWMFATLARPAVEEVNIDCPRHAVLDGCLTEAQRRGNEHACRRAVRRAQTHAGDKRTVGVHQAQAGFVQELGRWIRWAVFLGQGIEARDGEGLPPAAERRQARFADAERQQLGSPFSASAVAFSILGHALPHACAGEGGDTQELAACSKRGAYTTLGGRSGGKPRLRERCPCDKADKGGRNQRSLWLRGLHPGGRRQEGSRAARHRVKGKGIPTLRSRGPVPEHAQERHLEWLGTAAEPAADPSATAGSSGSAPAAAAKPRVAADPGGGPAGAAVAAAAASLPKRRPAAAREESLGELGVVDEELAAAVGPAGGALEGRRVRRRV
ncbi:unnamed protein product, partial [Prorocentrum cordatum]